MHIRYPLVYILNPKTLKHVVVWIPRSGFWSICRCLVIRSEDRATSEPEIHVCCVWTYTVFSVLCAQSSVLWHRISYLWLPISTQTLLVWDFQIRDDQPVLRAAVLSDELQVLDGLLGNFSCRRQLCHLQLRLCCASACEVCLLFSPLCRSLPRNSSAALNRVGRGHVGAH